MKPPTHMIKIALRVVRHVCVIGLLTWVFGIDGLSAQQVGIKLFDAIPTFPGGPQTSADQATTFMSTSLRVRFAPGDTAFISKNSDGTGDIVIDNFMTINNVQNICEGVEGQAFPDACLGSFIQNPLDPGVIGMPIEAVLTAIPPIDVSRFIPTGEHTVTFELKDFGIIGGNTDLFLVTTSFVSPMSTVVPAVDLVVESNCVRGQLEAIIRNAGNETVLGPIAKTVRLDRIRDDGTSTLFNDTTRLGSLNPQQEIAIAIPLAGCPDFSDVQDLCRFTVNVDKVRTTPECREQRKEGEVCEGDEANNETSGEVTSRTCSL